MRASLGNAFPTPPTQKTTGGDTKRRGERERERTTHQQQQQQWTLYSYHVPGDLNGLRRRESWSGLGEMWGWLVQIWRIGGDKRETVVFPAVNPKWSVKNTHTMKCFLLCDERTKTCRNHHTSSPPVASNSHNSSQTQYNTGIFPARRFGFT